MVDLAIADEDLSIDPAFPDAGEATTVTATVRNEGDLAVEDFAVELFSGDPTAGGSSLGRQKVTDPLTGGGELVIEFSFDFPGKYWLSTTWCSKVLVWWPLIKYYSREI